MANSELKILKLENSPQIYWGTGISFFFNVLSLRKRGSFQGETVKTGFTTSHVCDPQFLKRISEVEVVCKIGGARFGTFSPTLQHKRQAAAEVTHLSYLLLLFLFIIIALFTYSGFHFPLCES